MENDVHDTKELLDTLVLPQVLSSLHQERVVPFVVAPHDETFRTADGSHHFYLESHVHSRVKIKHCLTGSVSSQTNRTSTRFMLIVSSEYLVGCRISPSAITGISEYPQTERNSLSDQR